jgi:hypothetical protein
MPCRQQGKIKFKGVWDWCVRDPDGSVVRRGRFNNAITNAGLTHALSIVLGGGTQVTTWYMGLINTGATLAAADTMSSHAGWTEITSYASATRPEWTEDAAASQAITNTTDVTFAINGTVTAYGAFLNSNSTKGGTTGTLWATGAFASEQALVSGQTLNVTYSVTAANA